MVHTTSFGISDELRNKLKKRVAEGDESQSEIIRTALKRELNDEYINRVDDLENRVERIEQALLKSAMTGREPADYILGWEEITE